MEWMEENNVAVAWNADGQTQWELSFWQVGTNPNDGLLEQTPINYMVIDSIELGHWYVAQVRTLCDTDVFGPWSDSLLLYIGNPADSVTCPTPTGLHVASTSVGKAMFVWDVNPAFMQCEIERAPEGTALGSGTVQPAATYFTALNGLDTATWYWARVRALCGVNWYSNWTDTVMFYVPGDGSGPDNPDTTINDTTTAVTLAEQYTYLMPNPAREEVAVMSSFRVKAVELYAADGKLLQRKEVDAVGTTLDLKGLPAGTYFVRVHTTAGVTTKRLVVE